MDSQSLIHKQNKMIELFLLKNCFETELFLLFMLTQFVPISLLSP
jgi:hypothetical protein